MVLFTDGIPDAQDENGEECGRSRLEEVVGADANHSSQKVVDAIFAEVAKGFRRNGSPRRSESGWSCECRAWGELGLKEKT